MKKGFLKSIMFLSAVSVLFAHEDVASVSGESSIKLKPVLENNTGSVTLVNETKPWHRGFSGGLTITPFAFDMGPLKDAITHRENDEKGLPQSDSTLRIGHLDFNSGIDNYEPLVMVGFKGYAGLKDGWRIGGTVRGGFRSFEESIPKTDSVVSLGFGLVQTGFLLEHAFRPMEKSAIVLGGELGFGGYMAVFVKHESVGLSGFTGGPNSMHDGYSNNDEWENDVLDAWSSFGYFNMNVGFVHSFKKWFHLGIDLVGEFHFSGDGLSGQDSFFTSNPGGSIRFMFGRGG